METLERFLFRNIAGRETKQLGLGGVLRALELPQQADFYEKFVEDVKRDGEKPEPKKLYDIRDYGSI